VRIRRGVLIAAAMVAVVCCITYAASDSSRAVVKASVENNDSETARKKLEKAYRARPTDAKAAFDYARVAPCSVSVALFTRLAADQKNPDTLRAACYAELADYSFVNNAFKTAADRYRQADALVNNPRYRYLQALSFAAMRDTASARPILNALADSVQGDYGAQARMRCAFMEMRDGNYDVAYKLLVRVATPPDTAPSWTIALCAAKLECALRLGKADSAKLYERQLQPLRGDLLERDLLDLADAGSEKRRKSPAPKSEGDTATPDTSLAYTLQVGAFGSLDNATGLQKRLEQRFREVSILPVTLVDQVFYRVRIGTFSTMSAAERFGRDSCATAGIAFKVVEK
jgi:tetratricopeptide (TPR) repeat protein